MLYSAGSKSNNIICWDIGGKKGHFIELKFAKFAPVGAFGPRKPSQMSGTLVHTAVRLVNINYLKNTI